MVFLVKSGELPERKWYYRSLPHYLYGLEVCPLSKSDLQSLDFVVNRFRMNYEIICECRKYLPKSARLCVSVYQASCWQNVTMYSWQNSIVSNRRMIVIVNDSCYAAYYVVSLFLISN